MYGSEILGIQIQRGKHQGFGYRGENIRDTDTRGQLLVNYEKMDIEKVLHKSEKHRYPDTEGKLSGIQIQRGKQFRIQRGKHHRSGYSGGNVLDLDTIGENQRSGYRGPGGNIRNTNTNGQQGKYQFSLELSRNLQIDD